MALEESLELDASPALDTVDAVGKALDQVASSFASNLAAALSTLTEPLVTDVDVDTSEAQASLEELEAEPVDVAVDVDADASDALNSLDEVEAAAQAVTNVEVDVAADGATSAAAELDTVGDAAQDAGADAEQADGQFTLLGATLGQIAAVAAAVAGVSFFAGAFDGLKDASLSLALSSQLIETTGEAAGVTADEVRELTVDLEKLSGIDADIVQEGANVLLTFKNIRNELGEGSAVYDRAVIAATDLSVVMGTDVRSASLQLGKALNDPVLGVTALGRAGVQFTEEQKELIQTLVDENDLLAAQKVVLDELEGQVSGAAEAYGSSLGGQVEIAKRAFEDFSEGLVSTFLPLIEEILAIGSEEFFPALTGIVAELGPSLTALFQNLSPLVAEFGGAFVLLAESAAPGLLSLAESLGDIVIALTPAIPVVTGFLDLFVTGLAFIAEGAAALIDALGPVAPAIAGVAAALLLLNTNPIFAVITAVGVLATALGQADDAVEAYTINASAFNEANIEGAASADELSAALDRSSDAYEEFLFNQSAFAQAGVVDELTQIGLTASEVGVLLADGAGGFNEFVAAAVEAGAVDLDLAALGLDASKGADGIRELDDNIINLIANNEGAVDSGHALIDAFEEQFRVEEDLAEVQLRNLLNTEQLTQEQYDNAIATANASDGYGTWQEALDLATEALGENQAAAAANSAALDVDRSIIEDTAAGWVAFVQGVNDGTIASKDYSVVAQALGVELGVVESVAGEVNSRLDELVDSAVSKLPTAASALDGLEETYDPAVLLNKLNETTVGILNFTANIQAIAEASPEVAAFLAEQGPEAVGALASSLAVDGPGAIQSIQDIEDALEAQGIATAVYKEVLDENLPAALGDITSFAEEATAGLDDGLDFDGVTTAQVESVADVLGDAVLWADAEETATTQGVAIGSDLGVGIADGITGSTPEIEAAAAQAVADAEAAAREEADSNSPSRLFAAVGADLVAGLEQGLSAASDLTVGVGDIGVTAGASTGGVTFGAGSIVVTVPAGTENPVAFGETVGDALAGRIVEQLVTADLGAL